MEGQKESGNLDTVNIRPGVTVLSVLRHLNYQPWFALAEFVDNAIQSFHDESETQFRTPKKKLKVEIDIQTTDGGRIIIRDNAGGIPEKNFSRAFRAAAIPPDRSGLSEFGMGMKSAACWFAPVWSVRTVAFGEAVERKVTFDIANIVRDELNELKVETSTATPTAHFTEIILERPYKLPAGRTVAKIKDHLTDIYRVFAREGSLELYFNGEQLHYEEPEVLQAPYYKNETGPSVEWKREIKFDFGGGLSVQGFAAIRKTGSTSRAGFALFRRKRLIEGSGDEGYRPEYIFGKSNSFVYQRLFGELHLEGFDVSHTKDGFRWDENEEPFLALLKDHLSSEKFPLLQQAREYRVKASRKDLEDASTKAVGRTAESIEEYLPLVLPEVSKGYSEAPLPEELSPVQYACRRVIDLEFEDRKWRIVLELSDDTGLQDWLEISQSIIAGAKSEGRDMVGIRVSLTHPFMTQFVGADAEKLEIVIRIAASLGLSEKLAREAGVKLAGSIRKKLNQILHDVMAFS